MVMAHFFEGGCCLLCTWYSCHHHHVCVEFPAKYIMVSNIGLYCRMQMQQYIAEQKEQWNIIYFTLVLVPLLSSTAAATENCGEAKRNWWIVTRSSFGCLVVWPLSFQSEEAWKRHTSIGNWVHSEVHGQLLSWLPSPAEALALLLPDPCLSMEIDLALNAQELLTDIPLPSMLCSAFFLRGFSEHIYFTCLASTNTGLDVWHIIISNNYFWVVII